MSTTRRATRRRSRRVNASTRCRCSGTAICPTTSSRGCPGRGICAWLTDAAFAEAGRREHGAVGAALARGREREQQYAEHERGAADQQREVAPVVDDRRADLSRRADAGLVGDAGVLREEA